MKSYIILIQMLILGIVYGKSETYNAYFISPNGVDTNTGLSADNAFSSINYAFQKAQPGDTIFLMPGTYYGTTRLKNRHGKPDLPITLKSHAKDPLSFAIIDGQSEPSLTAKNEGLVFTDCSWINVENLVFRNCWTHVIQLYNSHYISIRSCHFNTGKRVIHARDTGTHHILVENCYAEHPSEVWKGWSWAALHHGDVSYYNGALLHPARSGGGHIMRGCTLKNVYNVFRTRPKSIKEDGNTEIYNNTITNIRDNEFEPETWAWNMHYAYNRHVNIHKMYSIDGVKGGNIYIYGNTYTQTTDPWAMEEVSGIFKYSAYKDGPLTYPCYAFNNSYYTDAKVLRKGESTNHQLKHFNNIYYFFQGTENFSLVEWQPGYEFDYDCINQDWPEHIYNHQQEKHGLKNVDPLFTDGLNGNFQLQASSPCKDAGKVICLPEFDWKQSFEGDAPDLGAYEGEHYTDGPAFRFIPSPEGAFYEEYPRISKHKTNENQLWLYFSAALDSTPILTDGISLYHQGHTLGIQSVSFPNHTYEMLIEADEILDPSQLSIVFNKKFKGKNGLSMVKWGSSIAIGKYKLPSPDLSIIPNQFNILSANPNYKNVALKVIHLDEIDGLEVELCLDKKVDLNFINHISIYSSNGTEQSIYEPEVKRKKLIFRGKDLGLKKGNYIAKVRIAGEIYAQRFDID